MASILPTFRTCNIFKDLCTVALNLIEHMFVEALIDMTFASVKVSLSEALLLQKVRYLSTS